MILEAYRGLSRLLGPGIELYLERRLLRGKEDPARFAERKGVPGRLRPAGPLVWLHGASVGEANSLLPLIGRLAARPGLTVLLTTGTVTSARMMETRLPPGALHQFVPVDRPDWVARFLDHWRPDLALWSESEFWPNLMIETRRRAIPMVLVNGRISPRSFRNWRRMPGLIARLLGCFELCLGQTEGDAQRLRSLGAPVVACIGNIKYAVPPLPADPAALASFQAATAGRPLWLAASTHAGEEAAAAQVHRRLADRHPGLLTVIVPRHPQRGQELARDLGPGVELRSQQGDPSRDCQIYLSDTMGELGLYYRQAPVVFIGKSLTGTGGQNPFEPAQLGAAVLFGPRMDNFPEMAPAMLACGAAEQVEDVAGLAESVSHLLSDTTLRERRRAAALAFAASESGVLERLEAILAPCFDRLEAPSGARS